jgi:hypothetical protein
MEVSIESFLDKPIFCSAIEKLADIQNPMMDESTAAFAFQTLEGGKGRDARMGVEISEKVPPTPLSNFQ